MGALPKNKITSAERGKRRAGNTPDIKKDIRIATIPLHKRGLVQSVLASMGIGKKEDRVSRASKKAGANVMTKPEVMSNKPSQPSPKSVPQKTAKRTQHKG